MKGQHAQAERDTYVTPKTTSGMCYVVAFWCCGSCFDRVALLDIKESQ